MRVRENTVESPGTSASRLEDVVEIFGGRKVLKMRIADRIEAHEALLRGLPGGALTHLVEHVALLRDPATFEKAVGMSVRTLQRRKSGRAKPLSPEQSGRAWKFAEIFARARALFGSPEEAARWLESPAMALNRERPIDLLATAAGVELVEDLLTRIEFGVYT